VIFAVADNGIGIAAREWERIFRRFYQVDSRLARETGGCGLRRVDRALQRVPEEKHVQRAGRGQVRRTMS
jgi:K+-sensing histidine kinase KdpD